MFNKTKDPTGWNFDNSYLKLSEKLYKRTNPKRVENPEVFILNKDLGKSLGLNIDSLEGIEGGQLLSGNLLAPGSQPIAQAYAGHQFGHFTILGDGRAVLLGEHLNPQGRRYDIQLKGAGKTAYSRGGDGRAGLGPMLREYIISEAMAGLGIPTTRSLAVVTSGENIVRRKIERSAILTRVAASHIRVGTFEYVATLGHKDLLRELADYSIDRHYPHLLGREDIYREFFKEVIKRQAELISKWQMVGFIHGVMNTDNMTISGETIDYGPCAFMDTYKKETVFSSIDRQGRYSYGNQPKIGGWNLARLGETLLPLLDKDENRAVKIVEEEISNYFNIYNEYWLEGMRGKLGILEKKEKDKELIAELIYLMSKYEADYTNIFRELSLDNYSHMSIYKEKDFIQWKKKWEKALASQNQGENIIREKMRRMNPSIIPRNYIVEEVLLAAENNNKSPMEKFLKALSDPYAYSEEQEAYAIIPAKTDKPYRTFCGT